MKPSWITDKVIENSKIIHELGGRFVENEGDWLHYPHHKELDIIVLKTCQIPERFENGFFPIWSARKCKEWLRKRGWEYEIYVDNISVRLRIWGWNESPTMGKNTLRFEASTEDVACQMAVIKALKK